MDKEQIRKEFNEFLDSASDETIREFLSFLKTRRDRKSAEDAQFGLTEEDLQFKNRAN